jgi:hypothetical protein
VDSVPCHDSRHSPHFAFLSSIPNVRGPLPLPLTYKNRLGFAIRVIEFAAVGFRSLTLSLEKEYNDEHL